MILYHYYDTQIGPFHTLSDLTKIEAEEVMDSIRRNKPDTQCANRDSEYMFRRRMYEEIMRKEFAKKGGIIKRKAPHYFVVESCECYIPGSKIPGL